MASSPQPQTDDLQGLKRILFKLRQARVLRRLARHKLFLAGTTLFSIILFMACFTEVPSTHQPIKIHLRNRFEPPGQAFWFGTDNFGRDLFSRVVHGARISLIIGCTVVIGTGLSGLIFGMASGYFQRLDNPLMRFMDALMAFPAVLLAVAIAAALGPSITNAAIALVIVYTPRTARIVRASVLVTREMEYVKSARATGAGGWWIIRKHILTNSLAPLIVQLSFIFAYAVLAEAMLSFLGLGPTPPTPTWGNIIAEGRGYLREASWITMFPGIFIAITVLGLNLIGDGLRDVLDPRMRVSQG
jgi:peptide/nickel transport system permease protein